MERTRYFCAGAYPALQRTLFVSTFVPEAVNRADEVRLDVAGKAVNAARALQRLGGAPVLGGFSGGSSGVEIERLLRAEGLDCRGLLAVEAPVRICQTILPSDGRPFTELVEEGPELDVSTWEALVLHCRTCLPELGDGPIILAGTMPDHASLDFYPALIRMAQGPVILDTSGDALFAALSARPDIVKINMDELQSSCALADVGTESVVSMARHILDKGVRVVGITHGAHTAFLFTQDDAWSFEIPSVEVVSALGSGDCVNAGMAFALVSGKSWVEAFAYGLACGSANAEVAKPGAIDAARVAALLPRVKVSSL